MATYNKFHQFVEDLAHGEHDLSSDQLVVALTNTAPVAGDEVLADLTEISYTNLSSRDITTLSSGQTTGTYRIVVQDLVLTASGAVGPFRYVVVYNSGPASNPLIAWADHGSSVELADSETFTVDFDDSDGLFSLV
jgi:hypothetical protein